MRRISLFIGIFIALLFFVFSTTALQAGTAKKFNLGVGGYFGIGGATDINYGWDNYDEGAFALGIQPEVQFFPVDNISVTFRCLWERYFYKGEYPTASGWHKFEYPVDVIPFLFGVRYYTPEIFSKTKIFLGGGIGATIMIYHPDVPGWDSTPDPEGRFAMDFYGGVEYEVINQLAISCMFNTMLPNIGIQDDGEELIARFMFFFGVQYYIPL